MSRATYIIFFPVLSYLTHLLSLSVSCLRASVGGEFRSQGFHERGSAGLCPSCAGWWHSMSAGGQVGYSCQREYYPADADVCLYGNQQGIVENGTWKLRGATVHAHACLHLKKKRQSKGGRGRGCFVMEESGKYLYRLS